jgi:acylphosphatase
MGTGKMGSLENTARVRLQIKGRVQGVYFRASTMERAQRLGIVGWVMNSPDGSVEVLAEGELEQLEKLINWCRKGPPGAKVIEVLAEWETSTQEFHSFFIKRSAR